MNIIEQVLKRKVSAQEQGFVELDSLGLIYPKNEYEISRPKFVIMDFDGNSYDWSNYRYLNGKKCRKFRTYICAGEYGRFPTYHAHRYLDTISNFRIHRTMLVNNEVELGIDKCPLTLYVQEQLKANPGLDVRKLQIPLEILNDSYSFFDEKVATYNKKHGSNCDFVRE